MRRELSHENFGKFEFQYHRDHSPIGAGPPRIRCLSQCDVTLHALPVAPQDAPIRIGALESIFKIATCRLT
jgi:hypothetical protein